jgi:CheY-like chemotaxis protein
MKLSRPPADNPANSAAFPRFAEPSLVRTLRVLVLDDDQILRQVTSSILDRSGYIVDAAEDGESGWEALRSGKYDLVVTDNDMPRLTGLQLVERLRSQGIKIPVILASASVDLGEADDHPGLALVAILHKPYPLAELLDAARRAAPTPAAESPGEVPVPDARTTDPARAVADHVSDPATAPTENQTNRSNQNPTVPMNIQMILSELESALSVSADETRDPEPQPTVPGRKKVLIVDDDESVRSSLADVLDCEGYDVCHAADGEAAIRSAVVHQPDLVLLDLNMPKMDGWTAFTKLEGVHPLLPVIVLTARPNQYKHAVTLGVDAFMEKPLNLPVLLRAIHKLAAEPENKHTRRITNADFVTRLLDNRASERF